MGTTGIYSIENTDLIYLSKTDLDFIGSPLFNEVLFGLENGKELVVRVNRIPDEKIFIELS